MTPTREQFLRFMSRGRQRLLREGGGVVRWPIDDCDVMAAEVAPGASYTLEPDCLVPSRVLGIHAVNPNVTIDRVQIGLDVPVAKRLAGHECRFRRFRRPLIMYPSMRARISVTLSRHCVVHSECTQYPDDVGLRCLSRSIEIWLHVDRLDSARLDELHNGRRMPNWFER